MANEFIIKKGLISKANSIVSGSLIVTDGVSGSFSGSFEGDGSGLTNVTASFSPTSSYALTASYVETAQTASYVLDAVSSSYSTFAVSASYAVSASHEIIKEVSSSYADTASFAQSGNGIFSGSFSGSFEGDGNGLTGVPAPYGKFAIANASGQYTYYSDLSSSLQAAISGDTIQLFTTVTESADHVYHLKDKVDFNFNGNELFYETSTSSGLEIFTDNGSAVTCSFYNGKVRFNQPSGGTNNLIKITGTGTNINNVGFEWEIMEGNSWPIYLQSTNGVLNGGRFIAGPNVINYFIRHYYTEIRNVEIITYNATATYSYFGDIKNSKIYGYFLNRNGANLIYQNASNLNMYDNYLYLEGPTTGIRNKVTNGGVTFVDNTIHCVEATGISCKTSIGNEIYVTDGDYGLTVSSEVVGGCIDVTGGQPLITANEVTSGVRVTGLSIRCKDYLGPAAQVGTNTSLMGCNFFEDYGQQDTDMIQVKTGCTGVEIANCTFDYFNVAGRVGNYGITAVDDDTVVKFANNTIIGGTLFEASKVTQGILNTPDAQGNMSMTF